MPTEPKSALTPRQQRFVEEYVKCPNGAAAARAAGYSEATAKVIAYELLRRDDIRRAVREHEEVDERMRGEERRYVLNSLRELTELSRKPVALLDRRGKKIGQKPADGATAVAALKLLGQNAGLFREGFDVRVQGAVEETLEQARPLMSPVAYAELLRAIAKVTGVADVAAAPAAGDPSGAVH